MKRYKLLKDLPNLEKGTILSEHGSASGLRILVTEAEGAVTNFISNEMFEKFFEEIQEPTNSIHWKPNNGDEYWYTDDCAGIYRDRWDDEPIHVLRYSLGLIKRTKEECEQARNRRLAEIRLRRTSTFKPDFKNGNGGWIVYYSYKTKSLFTYRTSSSNAGEPVHYRTEAEAVKSIKENEQDWKIYLGVEEEE